MESPTASERLAQQPVPAEDKQQGEPGHRRRQHDGQVDDRFDERSHSSPASSQKRGQRNAQGDAHEYGDGGRDQAQPQRIENRAAPRDLRQGRQQCSDHQDGYRQAEEQREQCRRQRQSRLPPATVFSRRGEAEAGECFLAVRAGEPRQEMRVRQSTDGLPFVTTPL